MFNGVLRGFTNNYWYFVFKLGVLYKLWKMGFLELAKRCRDNTIGLCKLVHLYSIKQVRGKGAVHGQNH